MKIEISVNIERVGAATYEVQTDVKSAGATHTTSKTYTKTNSIFPVYMSLLKVLRDKKDLTAIVGTNSPQFYEELKTLDDRETTLAMTLQDTIALQNIKLEVIQ